MGDRKELEKKYKNSRSPMGIYQVLNRENGKSLVGSSANLPGVLNRQRFMLKMGDHRNPLMQQDWDAYGSGAFDFKVLETLEPPQEPDYDPKEDLLILEGLWVEKLAPFGDKGYNGPNRPGA